MRKFSSVLVFVITTASVATQISCDPMPQQTMTTHNPPAINGYVGNSVGNTTNLFFDLAVLGSSIELSGMEILMYDQGTGHPPNPNQVGNMAIVNVFTRPNTRVGHEASMAGWNHIGTGELLIIPWEHGYSPVTNITDPVTNAPVVLPGGAYGVCVELVPTNAVGTPSPTGPNGANAGSLHTLALTTNPGLIFADQFLQITNDGIQVNGWRTTGVGVGPFALTANPSPNGGTVGSINIALDYQPAAGDGGSVAFGAGCYDRPRAAWESFPPSAAGPDLIDPTSAIGAGGGMAFTFTGSNYVVSPIAPAYVTPTSVNLVNGPYQNSPPSIGSWSDAISVPYAFPSTWPHGGFQHPGGVATEFGVTSNGKIYLGDVNSNDPHACGAPYESLQSVIEWEASLCGYFTDLDPTAGGGIYVDFDPAGNWVRVSWDQVPEAHGSPTALNTFSITMHSSGNVEFSYVALANEQAGHHGNNALVGYFEGHHQRVGDPVDWTTFVLSAMPQTGDGSVPPVLSLDARPQVGNTVSFVTGDLAATALGGFFLVSMSSTAPTSLGSYGAPGCEGHIDIGGGFVTASFLAPNPNNDLTIPFAIPNNPAFLTTSFYGQSLVLVSGINALGAVTSNGLCVNVGN